MKPTYAWALLATIVLTFSAPAQQVIISEVSSAQSDRLLQRPAGGAPQLGNLLPWHDPAAAVPPWWQSSAGPHGFGYTVGTSVSSSVQGKTPVLYLRRTFAATAAQAAGTAPIELAIDYDDGFVAYLNGVEVARRNMGAVGSYAWHHQEAFNNKPASGAETIALGAAGTLLRAGANVLAIQVHNSEIANGQFLCSATLRFTGGVALAVPGDIWSWFAGTHAPSGGLYDTADFTGSLPLGPDWTQPSYADSSWTLAPGALGFDTNSDYLPQLKTNLTNMRNVAPSLYMRREFSLTAAQYEALSATTLTVDWDDGYVLYLNGVEISRGNLPGVPGTFVPYNAAASSHPAQFEFGGNNPAAVVSVPIPRNLLRAGRNVISAQAHNELINSSDLLLDIRFKGTSDGSPLTFVDLNSQWRYRIGTVEFANPGPAGSGVIVPEFLDWIELHNPSATVADLSGWTLTDDLDAPAKWTLPVGISLVPGGYLVIAASGRDITNSLSGGLMHTNFSLSSGGEYLALRDASGTLQSQVVGMPNQNPFHTWGRDPGSSQYRYLARGTPGAANVAGTAGDIAAEVDFSKVSGFHPTPLSVALSTATPGATIRYTLDGSEPTSSSTAYVGPIDPTVRPTSGPGAGSILREFFQWSPGTVVLPANLPPGATPTSTQIVTQFETPTGAGDNYTHRVRGFLHPPQTGSYTFWLATDDDGELWLSTDATPGMKRRIATVTGYADSRQWTKFTTQQSVSIPLVAGQRYYIEALQSEGGGGDNCAVGWTGPGLPAATTVIEGRYLSPPDSIPPGTTSPPGASVLRARAFLPGFLPGEVRTRSYVTGLDPRLAGVPAFFLSGPAANTFYAPDGIFAQVGGHWNTGDWQPNDPRFDYNVPMSYGDSTERPAVLEIINPGNNLVERTTVGVRFAGSPYSRPKYQLQSIADTSWNNGNSHNKPQMNLFFRSDFGISRLKENGFIPTSTLKEWDTLRLRAGKNDAYNPFIVDEWMRRSFAAMGSPAPQGFIATVFINGQFKSYFNPTERPRESFFQSFHGSENPWDVNYIGSWEDGDNAAFAQMQSFFLNTDLTSNTAYAQAAAMWDMENVADYYIVNGWGATRDWIDNNNNYTFARERAAGAKWRYSMWDAEGAMGMFGQNNQHNMFESDAFVPENGSRSPAINQDNFAVRQVFRRACQNAEFRLLFADRLQRHFFNGGAMSRPVMNARWSGLRTQVEPLIAAAFGGGFNSGHWDAWAGRDATFLTQARNAGLWPVTPAPVMSPLGGTIAPGARVTLTTSAPAGSTIFYTTSGIDPRAVGGTAQGTVYMGPVAVSTPITIRARVRSSAGEWSPLIEADFAPPPQRLVFSEIHYNPDGPDDLTEFVEITNVSPEPAPLQGAHFTEGITFTFGNVTLSPGASVVLVKDAAAFAAAYPGVPIGGVFGNSLSNDGETLTLRNIAEVVILTLTYGDDKVAGWPADADGKGSSLVLRRQFSTGTDPAMPASWRASTIPGGNPGSPDSTLFTGNALADVDRDGHTALVEYALGTSDTVVGSLPLMSMSRDGLGRVVITFDRPPGADDVAIDVLESTNLTTWTPAVFESEAPVAGRIRASWRSVATGPAAYLRLRVRQL